jgi:hypothetical protein
MKTVQGIFYIYYLPYLMFHLYWLLTNRKLIKTLEISLSTGAYNRLELEGWRNVEFSQCCVWGVRELRSGLHGKVCRREAWSRSSKPLILLEPCQLCPWLTELVVFDPPWPWNLAVCKSGGCSVGLCAWVMCCGQPGLGLRLQNSPGGLGRWQTVSHLLCAILREARSHPVNCGLQSPTEK